MPEEEGGFGGSQTAYGEACRAKKEKKREKKEKKEKKKEKKEKKHRLGEGERGMLAAQNSRPAKKLRTGSLPPGTVHSTGRLANRRAPRIPLIVCNASAGPPV